MKSFRKLSLLALFFAALLISTFAGSATAKSAKREPKMLAVANLTLPAPAFHEGILRPDRLHTLDSPPTPYLTPDGMTIYVSFSDYYVPDVAFAQSYANFLGWLTHGTELNGLIVFVYTPEQVASVCGENAVACYGQNQMIVAGEDVYGIPVEQVVAHEYGHHVAAYRLNPPWPAGDWGPKRWATYFNVCDNASKGALFPGDEGQNYRLNPGEGWAEDYRRMNELRAGTWPDIGWNVVDAFFVPDATALTIVNQDVVTPWAKPTSYAFKGKLRRHGVRRWKTSPLDGAFRASVSGPKNIKVSLTVGGKVVRKPARSVGGVICGQDSIGIVVRATKNGGRFQLTVTQDD